MTALLSMTWPFLFLSLVIPTKAGIQSRESNQPFRGTLDPRLRGDDKKRWNDERGWGAPLKSVQSRQSGSHVYSEDSACR